METKHTQGEWKVEKPYFNYRVTCNGETVAQIYPTNEEEANAKLCAASPVMLDALETIYNNLALNLKLGTTPNIEEIEAGARIALSAIQKATN